MTQNKIINYSLIILFIGMWGSIGSDPNNYLVFFKNIFENNPNHLETSFIEVINLLRSIFPIFTLIICIFLILKYKFYVKQEKFIYLLFFIQIVQLISTFFSHETFLSNFESNLDYLGRYHWIMSSLSIILIFMIANKINNFDMRVLSYISIFFLSIMIIYFSYKNINDFFLLDVKTSIYNLNVFRESAYFLGHEIPRVTGISRSIIFLYILIFFLNFHSKIIFIYIKYFLLIILGSLIFFFQSKFSIILLIFMYFIFYKNFQKKINGIKLLILILILQITFFYTLSNMRSVLNFIEHNNIQEETLKDENIKNEDGNKILKKNKIEHLRTLTDDTKDGLDKVLYIVLSGRVDLWIQSWEYIKKRPFLGYGSMSDRIIINQKRLNPLTGINNNPSIASKINKFNTINPVSNAFIYSLLSGGVFSLILLITFFYSIRQRLIIIFSSSYIKVNYKYKIACLILFVIFLRCFIENSIMLFGVDYMILLNCLFERENT